METARVQPDPCEEVEARDRVRDCAANLGERRSGGGRRVGRELGTTADLSQPSPAQRRRVNVIVTLPEITVPGTGATRHFFETVTLRPAQNFVHGNGNR